MTKLAKYLPLHGVRPAVLTVANPSVPVRDESLLADVPASVEVARAHTLEPAYTAKRAAWRAEAAGTGAAGDGTALAKRATRAVSAFARQMLFPDPQVLWQPAAISVLALRMAAGRDDVILVSGPPFSQFLLAPLARAGGLGVVLDYRDEWSTLRESYEMGRSRLAQALGDPLEAALLSRADAVVTATEEFRERLLERFGWLDPGRVFSVPNGYDPDDFPPDLPPPPPDRFVVTHAGTVFALTSAHGLLGAVRRLHDGSPAIARHLRMRFLGRIVETEASAFEGSEAFGVERTGYVPHAQVLRELSASHLTVCILDAVAGAERIYPAKIFELMHLGRPVLTLAPPASALARLAHEHALGPVVHPRDEAAIASAIVERIEPFVRGEILPEAWRNAANATNAPSTKRYDRRALAGEFAEILHGAASAARRRGS
jgi:glycosyltransferase involved in cell wall biosynthesis